jgi:enterochelin esterase-like enzyme
VIDYTTAGSKGGLEEMGHQSVGVAGGSAWARAGRVDRVEITGTRTGITAPAYVYLPPQYFQKAFRKQDFPAAVILTGYPGTAESLITRMKYPQTATAHIKRGTMQPMIMVMMRPAVVPPRDTECMDVPHGPQVETFFTDDLRDAIEANYRVGRHARNWGLMGDSTGGYCSLKIAMQHPGDYSSAVSLSGYYSTHDDPTTGDLFGGSAALQQQSDLLWRLHNLPVPPVWTLVTTSRRGEGNYHSTLTFIKTVRPPMQVASIILPSGGHNFSTWNRELPGALDQLSHHLTQ